MVNQIMEKNIIFSHLSSGWQHIPDHVCSIDEEIFKSSVVDVVKCIVDTKLQHHYVGNSDGNVVLAGLGLPPSALTDDSVPNTETLFKRRLHELKDLLAYKAYLKNLHSTEAVVACF
jgi:hypothetical protein